MSGLHWLVAWGYAAGAGARPQATLHLNNLQLHPYLSTNQRPPFCPLHQSEVSIFSWIDQSELLRSLCSNRTTRAI